MRVAAVAARTPPLQCFSSFFFFFSPFRLSLACLSFVHSVASLIAVCLLSGIGVWQWWGNSSGYSNMQFLHHEVALIDQRAMNGEPLHAAERHYITHGPGLLIGQMGLAYQVYELVMTIVINDIRTALMVKNSITFNFCTSFTHIYMPLAPFFSLDCTPRRSCVHSGSYDISSLFGLWWRQAYWAIRLGERN